ncbi:MAG: HNH endonuclease [Anaerolineales bacterium]
MTTYLLLWNPKIWEWVDMQDDIAKVATSGFYEMRWSSGVTKKIKPDDRVFLMKLGVEPRGIVASGWATSDVRQNTHYRDSTKKALYIHVRFDTILEPNAVFPIEFLLNDTFYKKIHWTPQASGMSISDDVAEKLEKDWAKFINQPVPVRKVDYADEIDGAKSFYEGATKQVKVNVYERNAEARAICIKKYGASCSVCGFDFGKKFGEIGAGFIHVHHLKPLSEIRKGYKLNPVEDLRPVCPNCHAMLHQRKPEPYTIERLKAILKRAVV